MPSLIRPIRCLLPCLLAAGPLLSGCATTHQAVQPPEPTQPTHLLVMGGGSRPSSNQVSLEKNVNYFYRVVDRLGLNEAERRILFASGDDPSQDDLQYIALASDEPEVVRLIDMLIGPGKAESKKYRPHDIGGGEIASSKDHITAWFDEHAPLLTEDDRLLLYFTGHGGKGEKDNAQNTSLYLWPNHNMRMQPFVSELDKLNPQTPVVIVMVQCYSGGFANVIFKDGDPLKGLAEHNRCGFYAAVHSRTAAGCTPHVNEADYKEYSSYFWAALSGEDRLGELVDRPDYNGDGRTSYLEAHAYALIHSDSTDLSMTTTDRLVRAIDVKVNDQNATLLSEDSPYSELLAAADPIRKAVLEGLSDRLGLTGEDRVAQAKKALEDAQNEKKQIGVQRRNVAREMAGLRKTLLEKLVDRWPALKDLKSEDALAAVLNDAEAMRAVIAEEAAYAQMVKQVDELEALGEKNEAHVATIAHAERFVYNCESVAKIDTLLRYGKPEYFKAYYDLLEREMATPTP